MTFAPMRTMPESSRSFSASSDTFGMSRVTSSLPSLVSRACLDVDGRVAVVLHEALRDQDRILEVVASPRHEGDEDVAPQGQLALVRAGPVGDDVAGMDAVALPHDRPLVDARVLVRAAILRQVVDVQREVLDRIGLLRARLGPHHDAVGRDVLDHARPPRQHDRARVARHDVLHARADVRRLRLEERHRLALHVRSHEGAVGVVVLEKRHHGRGDRHELLRRHVHVVQLLGRDHLVLAALPGRHALAHEMVAGIQLRVGLGDDELLLLERGEPHDLVGDRSLHDLSVRRVDEPELVDPGVGGEGRDQADVRPFRGLDGADATVVGRVHVAHLEPGALAREAARTQGREPALVGQLGQRVRLVHELAQLRGAEELLDHGRDRLGVDEVVGHQVRDVGDRHPLLDGPLHARETNPELVLEQLAHRADAAVAEMVDVVRRLGAEPDLQEMADDVHDVFSA